MLTVCLKSNNVNYWDENGCRPVYSVDHGVLFVDYKNQHGVLFNKAIFAPGEWLWAYYGEVND